MYEELVKCADLMIQFGGHPMAAGLSIEEKNKNDGVVNIEIRALDTKTNETKVFPIEMTQMDNKMWRITGYDYKTYSLPYDGFDRI